MKQWSSWRSVTAAVFALSLSHSVAQQWKAELPTVEKAGLHRIVLSPEMVGRSREDLGDVQLVDSAARASLLVSRGGGRAGVESADRF
ncbi:MAG: hypothetical protein IPG74_14540 [Flavobacteriales bacterium]|nr:hypothetical protein [Flavobacteriales bacterium]